VPKIDTSHLELIGRSYRVQMAVPRHLRAIVGKAKLVRGLRTDSLSKANLLKLRVLHDFRQTLAAAERATKGNPDGVMQEALQWREAFAQEAKEGDGGPNSPDYVSTALEARVDELVRAGEPERAQAIHRVAVSKETPIAALVEDWLAERQMKPRQVLDSRRAITKLATWLTAQGHAATIEGVTKRIAGDYRMTFIRAGTNAKTANKDISFISSLFKFAERQGLVEDNPFRGQSLPKGKAQTGAGTAHKRPYRDDELARLLESAPATHGLRDALVVLALSGMRTEELARLKAGDLHLTGAIPYIQLRGTKSAAAARLVPVHVTALPILLGRARGKKGGDYLFEDLPTPREGSAMERGQPWTKAFGRLRLKVGITERQPGARQDNLDLHGLRRWFIARARDALNGGAQGFTLRTVAQVVGHKAGEIEGLSMTARYAGAEPLEALAAAVRAVRLPLNA
jgi:integrase